MDNNLRPAEASDAAFLLSMWLDIENYRFDPRPFPATPAEVLKESKFFLKNFERYSLNKVPKKQYFMIDEAGYICLFDFSKNRDQAEIGIVIRESHRRKGIGKTALLGFLNKAKELGLMRLRAEIYERNEASLALFSQCGFLKKQQVAYGDMKFFQLEWGA